MFLYVFLIVILLVLFLNAIYVCNVQYDKGGNQATASGCMTLFNLGTLLLIIVSVYLVTKLQDGPNINPNDLHVLDKNGQPMKLVTNSEGRPILDKNGKPVASVLDATGAQVLDKNGKPYQPLLDNYGNPIMDPITGKPAEPLFNLNGNPVRPKFDSQNQPMFDRNGVLQFNSNGQALFYANGTQAQLKDAPTSNTERLARAAAAYGTVGLSEAAIRGGPSAMRDAGNFGTGMKESVMGKTRKPNKAAVESDSEESDSEESESDSEESESEDEEPVKKSKKSKKAKSKK